MKEILHQITAIAMAFIVLFSTMSFTVDMHYCGDHLVDFSLFEAADTCGMEAKTSQSANAYSVMEMDCCTDMEFVLEGLDDLKISLDQLTFEQQTFVTTFFYAYINLFQGIEENIVLFKEYSPPFLKRDIQILNQTFLI